MKKQIVLSREFIEELDDLLDALVEREYFSSLEWALKYVEAIEAFIENYIGLYPAKKVPAALSSFGSFYITYRHNQRTTWYIIFDESDDLFFVRHIVNNHVSGQYFN